MELLGAVHWVMDHAADPNDTKPPAFDLTTTLGVQRALNCLGVTNSSLVADGKKTFSPNPILQ
jgi:hypothetical protein